MYATFSWELALEGVMVVWREDNTFVRRLLHILKNFKIQDESEEELSQKLLLSAHCIPLSHPPSMANQPIWQGNQSPMFNTSRKIKAFNLFLRLKTKRTHCSSFSLSLIKSEGKIKVWICEKVESSLRLGWKHDENVALRSITQVSFFRGDGLCNSPVFFSKGGFCALARFLPHRMRKGAVGCKREGGISGTGAARWALEAVCTPYLALFDSPSAPASVLFFGSRFEG